MDTDVTLPHISDYVKKIQEHHDQNKLNVNTPHITPRRGKWLTGIVRPVDNSTVPLLTQYFITWDPKLVVGLQDALFAPNVMKPPNDVKAR